jgi:hypothetical protein
MLRGLCDGRVSAAARAGDQEGPGRRMVTPGGSCHWFVFPTRPVSRPPPAQVWNGRQVTWDKEDQEVTWITITKLPFAVLCVVIYPC